MHSCHESWVPGAGFDRERGHSAARRLLFSVAAVGLVVCPPAYAQSSTGEAEGTPAAAEVPGDIIVTAQRRSERLQDIPMAITALGESTFERTPITNLSDIQRLVPNVNISPRNGSGVVSIRGIGFDVVTAGADSSVAIHTDGVYLSRPVSALSSLFDIDRIEVARGPQGTLYGRNATGGTINLVTRKPTEIASGYVDISYGNYNALAIEGAISGPLVENKLLARIAAKIEERDGFGTNFFNGRDIDDVKGRSIRAIIEARPSETFSLFLTGDYFRRDDSANATRFLRCVAPVCGPNAATNRGFSVPANPRDVNTDIQPTFRPEEYGVSLTAKADLGFADFSTISAYRKGSFYFIGDLDGTAQPGSFITREENYRTVSQELQLSSSGPVIDWIVGAYYFNERNNARSNGHFPLYFAPALSRYFQGGFLKTNAYAAFGEVNYHVTPELTLTVGARYSTETKRISDEFTFTNGPVNMIGRQAAPTVAIPCATCLGLPDKVKFNAFTPKFGLRYEVASHKLLYATVQKGFKSGGFAVGAVNPAFEPETIWSYEAGLKASWFDRALTTNIAVYHYDYKNLQVGQVAGVATIIRNAASAKVDGVEAEFQLNAGGGLRLDGFGAYNHARFGAYTSANPAIAPALPLDLSGNLLSNAPKWTGRLGAEYEAELGSGSLTLRGEIFMSSRVYFSPFNDLSNSQKPYTLLNANIRYEGADDWYASLFMNNIANRRVIGGTIVTSGTTGAFVAPQYLSPRMYGIKIGKKF